MNCADVCSGWHIPWGISEPHRTDAGVDDDRGCGTGCASSPLAVFSYRKRSGARFLAQCADASRLGLKGGEIGSGDRELAPSGTGKVEKNGAEESDSLDDSS